MKNFKKSSCYSNLGVLKSSWGGTGACGAHAPRPAHAPGRDCFLHKSPERQHHGDMPERRREGILLTLARYIPIQLGIWITFWRTERDQSAPTLILYGLSALRLHMRVVCGPRGPYETSLRLLPNDVPETPRGPFIQIHTLLTSSISGGATQCAILETWFIR